ncbi:MAG: protein kinase [Bryobacterales bacterium]|nr:protein kinase [Bryobacterales bacterium]
MECRSIEHYEILEKLGEGGMGVIYKARDTRLNRFAALKFLPASLVGSPEARDRFFGEARAIATLNHPNIGTIYEIRESEGAPVLVLEYLPGGTLRSRILARPLSPTEIARYGLQIAAGLEYAHRRGIVHGDVKTENLMFAEDGRLKITDFGLARFDDGPTVTLDGKVSGTPKYMAPECLRGSPADRQADIFALGIVLDEMAGGQLLPEAFGHVVSHATARDRSRRCQSMEELAAGLRRLEEAPAAHTCEAPTILVIEDDDALRSTVEMGLSDEGYQVLKAANGREGIRLATEKNPDLVLLDVMMPGPNGFDVCRELRHRGFCAPIIMVTGRTDEVDRVVGLEIGADDYLVKPYGQRELVARIRAHLRRGSASGDASPAFAAAQGGRRGLPDETLTMS